MALRLLIVDDNAGFLEAARALLEREGLHVVAVASTSDEALRCVREHEPDVTLVDVDLGDESGVDLARRLTDATEGATPRRVVLISAYAEADLRPTVEASAAVGFLPKAQLSSRALHDLLGEP
jgi:CheY-like chemotaxis protein